MLCGILQQLGRETKLIETFQGGMYIDIQDDTSQVEQDVFDVLFFQHFVSSLGQR